MNKTIHKPFYAQGWVLGLFWGFVLVLAARYLPISLMGSSVFIGLGGISFLFSLWKFFKGIVTITLTEKGIMLYRIGHKEPFEMLLFGTLQVLVERNEVNLIVDAKQGKIITLKSIYWPTHWDEMLEILSTKPAHIRRDHNEPYFFPKEDIHDSPLGVMVGLIENLNSLVITVFNSIAFIIKHK